MSADGAAFESTSGLTAEEVLLTERCVRQDLFSYDQIIEDSITGLGSTRMILAGYDNAKERTGDVDLLVKFRGHISGAFAQLEDAFEGYETKTFFGNIFSVAYDAHGELGHDVQVDVMLAPVSQPHVYQYLRKFRFWSGESAGSPFKGIHRTELLMRVCKAAGLSCGTMGFKKYRWSPAASDVEDLVDRLEDKLGRTRKDSNKEDLEALIDHVSGFDTLSGVFRTHFHPNDATLSTRLRFGPVPGRYAVKTMERLLCEGHDLRMLPFAAVMERATGVIHSMVPSTFGNALEYLKNAHTHGPLNDHDVRDVISDYREAMTGNNVEDYWYDEVQQRIAETFPEHEDLL